MISLVDRIIKGDEQAIITFYKTFSPRILRYLQKHLPPQIAQELLNDVFFEAVDSLPRLHKQTNLQAWLYKIAHNKMVDYYRKKKIKSFLFSQVPYLEFVTAEINQPEFQLEKERIRGKIESALLTISKRYQQILRMRYEKDMSVKTIALTLNLSFKATESLLYRARKDFIKEYERT